MISENLLGDIFEECIPLFIALGDRTRLTVSHHLKILKDTGLIDVLRKGVCNYYYLTNKSAIDKLGRLKEELEKYPES